MLELPIGSFVPGQAPIIVEIKVQVDCHADAGFPLAVKARGGFRFGTSALGGAPIANPSCPMAAGSTAPTVATIHKSYVGPEDETATGPNFSRKYKITVDVADGQTLSPVQIVDCLPDNLAVGPLAALPPGCVDFGSPPECPGAGISVVCSSVSGTASPVDLTFDLDFHVPEKSSSGEAVLGDSCTATSVDDVRLLGYWDPLDPRDPPPVPILSDVTPADHTLTDRCLAIQKTWNLKPGFDLGAPGPTPGDIVLYTLDFQVSDFRTLDDLVVDDYLSDGQSLVPGSALLEIKDKFGVVTGAFTPADLLVFPVTDYECSDGTVMVEPRLLRFNVSNRLASLHAPEPRHAQGILTGGLAGQPNAGPTTGRITFEARIDDEFRRQDPSLESFVDKDDELLNCVEIAAQVLVNADAPAIPRLIVGSASDRSLQRFPIVHGTLKKTVYAINGNTTFPQPVKVDPGDLVTFRIEYSIPSGDAEDFYFEDYLPLPIFRSDKLTLAACLPPPPPAERVTVTGPLCSDPLTFAVTKAGGNPPANSFKLSFGDLDDPANAQVKADVYFTTQVTSEPFADGLALSNHVLQHERNTFGQSSNQTEIAPVIVGEPRLRIRKGVVSSSKKSAVYTPAPPVPCGVKFTAPGISGPAFSGVLSSSNVGTALNSDVSQVDGCDLVKFAIVVENLGSSTKGAFDVRIGDILSDILPACLKKPPSKPFFNLQVVNGKGKPFTCNRGKNCGSLISSFFSLSPTLGPAGITLDDGVNGSLAPYSPAGGANLAIITFDAQVPCGIQATRCCNNVAKILGYAGVEGGPNHTQANFSTPFPAALLQCPPAPTVTTPATQKAFEDGARVCVQPQLKKSILATSEVATGKSAAIEHLAIGEIVRYCLEVTLPEGVSPKMVISDQLPLGLEWLKELSLPKTCVAGMRDPKAAQPCTIGPKDPKVSFSVQSPQPSLQGGSLTVNLGTVTNSHDDPAPETFVVKCNALVLNDAGANVSAIPCPSPPAPTPACKPNSFTVKLTPSSGPEVTLRSNTVLADIVEPMGEVKKEEVPVCLLSGARYRLSFANNGTAAAFEVRLKDNLPPGVTVSGPVAPDPSIDPQKRVDLAKCAVVAVDISCPRVDPGKILGVEFEVEGISACQPYENRASLVYSSLPGSKGTSPNQTGSKTPGVSGKLKGERLYSSLASLTTLHCPDLAIDHQFAATNDLHQGSILTFTVTVTNVGTTPSFPPTVVENSIRTSTAFPPGTTLFVAGGGSGWSCTGGNEVAACTSNDPIPAQGSSTFTMQFEILKEPPSHSGYDMTLAGCEDTNLQNNSDAGFL